MKKSILMIVVALGAMLSTANSFANTNYILVEGRSSAMQPVVELVNNINNSGVPVYTKVNNEKAYFNVSYIENNALVTTERIHLSNSIIDNLKRHLANPQTGESILAVCGQQAGGFIRVVNTARTNNPTAVCNCSNSSVSHQTGCDLTEVNGRLQRIENNQQVLNDNVTATYQQTALANQKLDDLIAATNENTRQIKKARTESWVQTGLQLAGTAYLIYRVESERGKTSSNYYSTTTTTTNNYGGGTESGSGETWGGNTNRGGVVWGGNYNN